MEVLCRISTVGSLEKTSVGRSFGKTSAESFEIANYLICDAPYSTGRDEEEEDTFSSLKSPETSGCCWRGCVLCQREGVPPVPDNSRKCAKHIRAKERQLFGHREKNSGEKIPWGKKSRSFSFDREKYSREKTPWDWEKTPEVNSGSFLVIAQNSPEDNFPGNSLPEKLPWE